MPKQIEYNVTRTAKTQTSRKLSEHTTKRRSKRKWEKEMKKVTEWKSDRKKECNRKVDVIRAKVFPFAPART